MKTRYVFTDEAKIFLPNGLKLSDDFTPSNMATRILVSNILDGAFIACNRSHNHKCNATCGSVVRMLVGPFGDQKAPSLRNSMPTEVIDVLDDFELLLDACLGIAQGVTRVKSIGIRFLPCIKILEISSILLNIS